MYDIESIDIGLTTRCNAGCPQCARTDPSISRSWKWMKMEELYLDDIKKIFPPEVCSKIKKFSLCGGYGDPLIARDVLEIIEYFFEHSPNAELYIATNGSMKKPIEWWHRLGKILKGHTCQVTFGIDGADQETHQNYRVNTNLDTIFRNVENLQMYKVSVRWQFLLFDYNRHQLETVKQMAKEKKFDDFFMLTTTRLPVGEDFYPPEHSSDIIASSTSRFRNYNYFTKKKYNSIDCLSEKNKEVHLTASGVVVPCCYVDDRYTITRYLKEYEKIYNINFSSVSEGKRKEVRDDIENLYYGMDFDQFNAKKIGLKKVLENPWWDTFFEMQKEFKIHKCNDVCGVLK